MAQAPIIISFFCLSCFYLILAEMAFRRLLYNKTIWLASNHIIKLFTSLIAATCLFRAMCFAIMTIVYKNQEDTE